MSIEELNGWKAREFDALRAKVENQRQRINYLEGATHHAGGTPLSVALARIADNECQINRMAETARGYREALERIQADAQCVVEDMGVNEPCYVLHPGRPDLWCHPCIAHEALGSHQEVG